MEAGAVLNLPSCKGGGSKVSGPLLHSVTREEMRPWLTLLHHLAPHPSRQVTEPRGHLCLEAGHSAGEVCERMWSNVCIWWWVYLRGRGNLKQDNWGEHAVTCQRCHIEDVTFVRSGWKRLTLRSVYCDVYFSFFFCLPARLCMLMHECPVSWLSLSPPVEL